LDFDLLLIFRQVTCFGSLDTLSRPDMSGEVMGKPKQRQAANTAAAIEAKTLSVK